MNLGELNILHLPALLHQPRLDRVVVVDRARAAHRAQLAVLRLRRGDDERVGRRVGLDEAAGGDLARGRDRSRRLRRGGP